MDHNWDRPKPLKNYMKCQCFHTKKKFVVGTSFRTFTFRIVIHPSMQFNVIDLPRLTCANPDLYRIVMSFTHNYKSLCQGSPFLKFGVFICHIGGILLTVQSLNLMSYFQSPLTPFFGDLELCYGKNWNSFWNYMSGKVCT